MSLKRRYVIHGGWTGEGEIREGTDRQTDRQNSFFHFYYFDFRELPVCEAI